MFQNIKVESEKAQSHHNELHQKLVEVDTCKGKAEEKVRELNLQNTRLKIDLAAVKQKGQWVGLEVGWVGL